MTIASRAHAPIVTLAGEQPLGDDDFVQQIKQERFAEAIEAEFIRVNSGDQALDCVRKAFYLAKVDSRPVILSVPMNVAQQQVHDDLVEDYVPSRDIIQLRRTRPSQEDLQEAANLIAASEKPLILAGRGAIASGAGAGAGRAHRCADRDHADGEELAQR